MIYRQDPRYNPIVCCVCGRGEFDHSPGARGRCNALTPDEYAARAGYHAQRREDDAQLDALQDGRVR